MFHSFSPFHLSYLVLGFFLSLGILHAQEIDPKVLETARKKIKKELADKALRLARKEAKDLQKRNYFIAPGALPMEKQLELAYIRQYEEDEDGHPLYIAASGEASAQTRIAARNQAIEAAKIELAGQIESTIVGMIENSIANNQQSQQDATSLTKTVTASKSIVMQKLGRVIILFEAYREGDRYIASAMRIGYNQKQALNTYKQTLREQLEKEANDLHKKIDDLIKY